MGCLRRKIRSLDLAMYEVTQWKSIILPPWRRH